jgi:hypothetical protein
MSLDGTHPVMRTPRVRFARPHCAPGLEWSDYQPLLPDREIAIGDPTDPGALDGVDVLVAAAVDAELSDVGGFGLIQQIGRGHRAAWTTRGAAPVSSRAPASPAHGRAAP